ncbi:hypothetical protein DRN73_05095 [Candidatus Pacearchaeota archaeon]|nr:MAG: hypothetical protein DRN73_05095 [Candidatus Pacearchaeota archaeon]
MNKNKWQIILLTDKKVFSFSIKKVWFYTILGVFLSLVILVIIEFIYFSNVYLKALEVDRLRERNKYLEEQNRKIIQIVKELEAMKEFRKRISYMLGVDKSLKPFEFINYADTTSYTLAFEKECILPVSGKISLKYNSMHSGIDIAASPNTPVKSVFDGIVKEVAFSEELGNYIIIVHPGNYKTVYGHLEYITVKPGQPVSKGDIIGYVGQTGKTTGPHLHFEVWKNDKPINPEKIFKSRGDM